MENFSVYANYYDSIYKEKDYCGETDFVVFLLNKLKSRDIDVLCDLGCGTGKHALEFSKRGFTVFGVDKSIDMINTGKRNISNFMSDSNMELPELSCADAQEFTLPLKADAVVSLFHVMSYITRNEDIISVLRAVHRNLNDEGLFLFDFWYGPGVLKDPPYFREKYVETDNCIIVRKSTPTQNMSENTVHIRFDVNIHDKLSQEECNLTETHLLRYWFFPELRYLGQLVGFDVVGEGIWMNREVLSKPTMIDWNGWIAFKKIKLS